MKRFFFVLYSILFNIYKLFGVRSDSVVLVSMHNASFNDSLGYIRQQAELRGLKTTLITRKDIELVRGKGIKQFISSVGRALRFFTVSSSHLARAKYIFLNDTFMPLAYAKPNKKTVIVQLWHAQGAFKKFGLDIELPKTIRKREKKANSRLTFVVCSSVLVEQIYANAFGVSCDQVLPLGSPSTDYFFENHDIEAIRAGFDEKYPQCKGKKLLLYAPTFRENKGKDAELLNSFNAKCVEEALGGEYSVLIRLHPQVHSDNSSIDRATDVTDYENINELCLICDMLITDYSSVCMDFSIQKKPMLFYAFDLEEYEQNRDFYFEYESYVPGKVAKSMPELLEILKSGDFAVEKNRGFREFNFGDIDGTASKKVADAILMQK
ncbi:MAG: CDP-glycerol glycerophosphotransferase family protein [Oscillospiraceae bacterium]